MSNNDKKENAICMYFAAYQLLNEGEFDLAIEGYEKAISLFMEIVEEGWIGSAYKSIGLLYYFKKDNDNAIDNFRKAADWLNDAAKKGKEGVQDPKIVLNIVIDALKKLGVNYTPKNLSSSGGSAGIDGGGPRLGWGSSSNIPKPSTQSTGTQNTPDMIKCPKCGHVGVLVPLDPRLGDNYHKMCAKCNNLIDPEWEQRMRRIADALKK